MLELVFQCVKSAYASRYFFKFALLLVKLKRNVLIAENIWRPVQYGKTFTCSSVEWQ